MKKTAQLIIVLFLPVTVMLFFFQFSALDIKYFMDSFEKNRVEEITGLKNNQLEDISTEIIKYLRDKRKDFNITAQINDENVQVFNGREKEHMKDVKKLFMKGYALRNIMTMLLLPAVFFLFLKDKYLLLKSFRTGALLWSVIFASAALIVYYDFNRAFIVFHEIFFSNDLWILDPETDIMIQMLPQNFFSGIALRTAVMQAGYFIGTVAFSTILLNNNQIKS